MTVLSHTRNAENHIYSTLNAYGAGSMVCLDEMKRSKDFLFRWRKAFCSEVGPPSTARLVLLTLSLHMDMYGGQCFPSTRTLAKETGLTRRAVENNIKKAIELGWLKKQQRGLDGRAWRRCEYTALIPSVVGNHVPHVKGNGGEPRSPRQSRGGEPRSHMVGNQVPTSTSIELSNPPPSPPKGERSPFPGWLDRRVWSEFKKMRQKMRAPITDYAEGRLLTKLNRFRETGHDPNEILNTSIENSWKGVFEPKRPATASQTPTPQAEEYNLENLIHREV